MSAFPNYRSVPSVPVDTETAQKFLEAYLEATISSSYLLPNARLESSGPTTGSSNSSITIYNLKRVEAGLRGEWLAPSLELEETNTANAQGLSGSSSRGPDDMDAEGWQDLDEYQRDQEAIEGELGPNDTEVELEAKPSKIDKEARKREKKLRMKEEKRRKEKSKGNAQSEE